MGLFSRKKKSDCCNIEIESVAPVKKTSVEQTSTGGKQEIIVLGTGCAKCKTTMQVIEKVVSDKNIDATVRKEEDIVKIMEYNVMSTPAVVLNGKIVVKGRVPKENEIVEILEGSTETLSDGKCSCGGKC